MHAVGDAQVVVLALLERDEQLAVDLGVQDVLRVVVVDVELEEPRGHVLGLPQVEVLVALFPVEHPGQPHHPLLALQVLVRRRADPVDVAAGRLDLPLQPLDLLVLLVQGLRLLPKREVVGLLDPQNVVVVLAVVRRIALRRDGRRRPQLAVAVAVAVAAAALADEGQRAAAARWPRRLLGVGTKVP